MSVISTIDCTLRDGGYLNNWEFDTNFQLALLNSLIRSNVDLIECGFISQNTGNDTNGTHFKSIEKINSILRDNGFNNSASNFAVMMRLDEYNPDDLPQCDLSENTVSVIRVMIYKNEVANALPILNKILKKGYKLHLQPTIISHYSDEEIVNMLEIFSKLDYEAVSIVDTFGSLGENDIKRITLLFDKYARHNAKISLHCHNNLSRAYNNALAFASSVKASRDIFIDSSVNGIGRGAGNLPTEILLTWLKNEKNMQYSILPVNEFKSKFMQDFDYNISKENSYAYALSARKNMHPNYAAFLILNKFKRTEICKILELILPEKYETFDFEYIKSLCEINMIKA